MKEIPLTQGKYAIVDDSNYRKLIKHKWHLDNRGYARRYSLRGGEVLLMHRVIMKTPRGKDTDHINRDKLDNRRDNLRICTRSQNKMNQLKQSNNTSGFKGVVLHKDAKKYQAQIIVDKKYIYLGLFNSLREAALVYNDAAKKYFGQYALLNLSIEDKNTP